MADSTLELILSEIIKLNNKFDLMNSKVDAMDSKFESKFAAMDSKFESKFAAMDSKFESLVVKVDRQGADLHALSGMVHSGFVQVGAELAKIKALAERNSVETAQLKVRVGRIEKNIQISSN